MASTNSDLFKLKGQMDSGLSYWLSIKRKLSCLNRKQKKKNYFRGLGQYSLIKPLKESLNGNTNQSSVFSENNTPYYQNKMWV